MVTVRGDLIVLIFFDIVVIPVIFFVARFFFELELAAILALEAMFVSISTSIYVISRMPKKKNND